HPACATESANVGKEIEMIESNLECLHPSHRKTGHRTMIAIRKSAESRIDVGNQCLRNIIFECGRHIAHGFHHLRRAKRLSREIGRSLSCTSRIAIRHNHDHWLTTLRSDEIVQNEICVALANPTGLVFATTMLKVKY